MTIISFSNSSKYMINEEDIKIIFYDTLVTTQERPDERHV